MRQYGLIINLERETAEKYRFSSLPLHLTVLSIFFSEADTPFLATRIEAAASEVHCFNAKTTGRAMFGVDKDIPVTLVENSRELEELHVRMLNSVSDYASFRSPQFVGDGYGPHISDQGNKRTDTNIEISVDNLLFVEIIEQDVFVRSAYSLKPAT